MCWAASFSKLWCLCTFNILFSLIRKYHHSSLYTKTWSRIRRYRLETLHESNATRKYIAFLQYTDLKIHRSKEKIAVSKEIYLHHYNFCYRFIYIYKNYASWAFPKSTFLLFFSMLLFVLLCILFHQTYYTEVMNLFLCWFTTILKNIKKSAMQHVKTTYKAEQKNLNIKNGWITIFFHFIKKNLHTFKNCFIGNQKIIMNSKTLIMRDLHVWYLIFLRIIFSVNGFVTQIFEQAHFITFVPSNWKCIVHAHPMHNFVFLFSFISTRQEFKTKQSNSENWHFDWNCKKTFPFLKNIPCMCENFHFDVNVFSLTHENSFRYF